MKRQYLFEFEDQPWYPDFFRGCNTDLLKFSAPKFYQPVIEKLQAILTKTNCTQIVDLCSGSGGPLPDMQRSLQSPQEQPIQILLTDKYPNIQAFQNACQNQGSISFVDTPVDATAVSADLKGLRTLFTGFHHLRDTDAQKVLQDAVDNNAPIGIFEFTERSWLSMVRTLLFGPLIAWLITPFLKPFQWQRWFWTYIIPLIPFVYTWDGIVSNLRTFSPQELSQMVAQLKGHEKYIWEIGRTQASALGVKITYLIGYLELKPSGNRG